MVGIAELYIPAFVEALGLGPVAVGLVATIPMCLGAWAQLKGPVLLRRLNSFPKFVALTAYVQGAMYVPLAAIALTAHWSVPYLREHQAVWVLGVVIFLLVSVYYAAGLGCSPAWTALTGAIIPARIRHNYFARRLRYLQGAQLVAILAHGTIMTLAAGRASERAAEIAAGRVNPAVAGFAIVFVLAAVFRAGSAWYLSRYSEPRHSPREESNIPIGAFLARLRHGRDGRFVLFAGAMNAASLIANPFFNPFMLDQLRLRERVLSEGTGSIGSAYAFFLAATYLGRVLVLPRLGRYAQRRGAFRVLITGSFAIIGVPLLWLVTENLWVLLAFQLLIGAAQATFEYAASMMFYEAVHARERTSVVTHYTFLNEAFKSSGSLLGAGLLRAGGADAGAYTLVFCVSAGARVLMLPLLMGVSRLRHSPEEIRMGIVGEVGGGEPMVIDVARPESTRVTSERTV